MSPAETSAGGQESENIRRLLDALFPPPSGETPQYRVGVEVAGQLAQRGADSSIPVDPVRSDLEAWFSKARASPMHAKLLDRAYDTLLRFEDAISPSSVDTGSLRFDRQSQDDASLQHARELAGWLRLWDSERLPLQRWLETPRLPIPLGFSALRHPSGQATPSGPMPARLKAGLTLTGVGMVAGVASSILTFFLLPAAAPTSGWSGLVLAGYAIPVALSAVYVGFAWTAVGVARGVHDDRGRQLAKSQSAVQASAARIRRQLESKHGTVQSGVLYE